MFMSEYRARFAKENKLKFLSHLELIRAMVRSLRRAGLEMAYSEGFHPHPKLSFGPALAVGVSSSHEFFDLQLTTDPAPDLLKNKLNMALPEGLKILDVKKITHHVKPLNAIINRASYSLLLRAEPGDIPHIIESLHRLPERDQLFVDRRNKDGMKTVNIRPWLHNVNAEAIGADRIMVNLVGEIGSGGNLRPEDLVGLLTPPVEVLSIHRSGLWHEDKGQVIEPMQFCEHQTMHLSTGNPEGNR